MKMIMKKRPPKTKKKTPAPKNDMDDLFYIDATFCTDGDFSFREAEREEIKKEFNVKFDFDDCEDYYLNGYLDRMHMAWLLHHLMTSFHVGAGHFWLVPELYNLFNDAFEDWHLKDEYYGSISGNYNGTEVYIHKVTGEYNG